MIQHPPISPGDARDPDWLNDILGDFNGATVSPEELAHGGIDRYRFSSFPSTRVYSAASGASSTTATSWAALKTSSSLVVAVGDLIELRAILFGAAMNPTMVADFRFTVSAGAIEEREVEGLSSGAGNWSRCLGFRTHYENTSAGSKVFTFDAQINAGTLNYDGVAFAIHKHRRGVV